MAQVDYFLKLDGIPGESVDSKHKDEISRRICFGGERRYRPRRATGLPRLVSLAATVGASRASVRRADGRSCIVDPVIQN